MLTLKEALTLPKEELINLKNSLKKKVKEQCHLNAYVEQCQGVDITDSGEGIPILIKDNINVKGWELNCASRILEQYVSPYNATAVENLMRNGFAPFGRANMDEFAMGSSTETSWHGITRNPIDAEKVPGGSSGGSAAAVGGGIALAALGSDTGGSIRQPAAFCGCVGFKPTYGRISRYGLVAFSSSLDQIGPITQNVEDSAILYDALSGYDMRDSTSANTQYTPTASHLDPNRRMTIAVLDTYIADASPEVQNAFLNTVKTLENMGHTLVSKRMLDMKYHIATYYVVAAAEASANLARFDGVRYGNRINADTLKEMYIQTRSNGFGEEVKRRILLGTFVLSAGYYDAYYVKAQKVRHLIKDAYDAIFREADLILSPVTPTTAFALNSKSSPLEMYLSDTYTISVNLAGLPALSLPVARGEGNLPIGIQLIGKSFDEQSVLDGAYGLEREIAYL
jgi:aspartyl-tRNA(Asn)/glutamyl-tRNA(Gln) amidotransferase subunit A